MKSITGSILIFLHRLSSTLDVSCEKHDSWTCFNTWFSQLKAYCEIKIKILACQNLRTLVIKQLGYNFWRYAVPFLYYFVRVDVFCCLFTLFWALLSRFTLFYAFLLQNQKYAHFSGWNYRKNYRKPTNLYFSNYRQKYRYRFKTSSNYRWFEEIIGKVIDIEIDSKIIEKLSLSKKMTYRTPLVTSLTECSSVLFLTMVSHLLTQWQGHL